MKIPRHSFLVVLLLGGLGTLLWLWWLAHSYEEQGQNYAQIEDGLYLGGSVDAPPDGTRAVLNLCDKDDPYRTESYRWESIPDTAPGPELDWLRQQVDWVADRRKDGQTTFVHCRNGVSRSSLVVTAYLMARNNWTRDEALAYVRKKRPEARPNPAFMRRLLEWERVLHGQPAEEKEKEKEPRPEK
jgi:hypothetical protein